VEQSDVFSGGGSDAGVAGAGKSPVLLLEVLDLRSVGAGHLFGVVLGTVVDHHNLEVPVGLGQDAIHGLGQILGTVVGRNHYRYLGHPLLSPPVRGPAARNEVHHDVLVTNRANPMPIASQSAPKTAPPALPHRGPERLPPENNFLP